MSALTGLIGKIATPGVYHGHKKTDRFFEGWYFKMVDKSGSNIIAVIPGIFKSREEPLAHSFIQFLDGITHQSCYFSYGTDEFTADHGIFRASVAGSAFSPESINLNINKADARIRGSVRFINTKPWPVTLASPGIMGWYSYVPFMECNHGVLSLDHELGGSLEYNGRTIDFTGGRGYIEKDWGSNFPSSYVWLQTNHFEAPGISFTGSVARIPWLKSWFRGYIFGLLLDGRLYRLTTYTGAKLVYLKVSDEKIELEVKDKHYRLEVEAIRTKTGTLFGPYGSRMVQRVSESLDSEITIRFYSLDKSGERLLFSGKGIHAGVEANGALEEITD